MEEKYRYSVSIQFEYEGDNGKTTETSEIWLIYAVSVTDAEAKANKEISKIGVSGHTMACRIKEVKETKITKVIE